MATTTAASMQQAVPCSPTPGEKVSAQKVNMAVQVGHHQQAWHPPNKGSSGKSTSASTFE
jgi:hypothetical protein